MWLADMYVKDEYAYRRLKHRIKSEYPKAKLKKTITTLLEGQPILLMKFDPNQTKG